MNFDAFAGTLARARKVAGPEGVESRPDSAPAPLPTSDGPIVPGEHVFTANARLVEVYATVTDARGRYIDGLSADQFTVLEEGKPQRVSAFESHLSALSCALVLDTTSSMEAALPALKNAALKLTDELRASDSVAVYSFNNTVYALQRFTTDKRAAKRAVLRTSAIGDTALYDALVQVNRDLSARSGKKVIIVFTDGDDNYSTLNADAAIRRAKSAGVPVYTIAQGSALTNPRFLNQLASISRATGGLSFSIREPREIRKVFESVANDLLHGYLFAFQPSPAEDHAWRKIEVLVRESKGYKVRAREGYYPE